MSFLWWLLLMVDGGSVPNKPAQPLAGPDGFYLLELPRSVLEEASFRKRLYSGLTTSIEIRTEVRPKTGSKQQPAFCILEIRYEIWEERLLVHCVEADRTMRRATFPSVEELQAWLTESPLKIAPIPAQKGEIAMKVQCRIIPFSQAEERQTKAWFSDAINVPEASNRGQQDRDRERSVDGENSNSGIFEVLMTTGIRRKSSKTLVWKWRLGSGG